MPEQSQLLLRRGEREKKNKIKKKKKTGGGPAGKSLDKISSTISEMLPQQIYSLQNQYDHNASLHRAEPEDYDEDSDDKDEVHFAILLN